MYQQFNKEVDMNLQELDKQIEKIVSTQYSSIEIINLIKRWDEIEKLVYRDEISKNKNSSEHL